MNIVTAVSYTHLDVYKRQVNELFTISGTVHHCKCLGHHWIDWNLKGLTATDIKKELNSNLGDSSPQDTMVKCCVDE